MKKASGAGKDPCLQQSEKALRIISIFFRRKRHPDVRRAGVIERNAY